VVQSEPPLQGFLALIPQVLHSMRLLSAMTKQGIKNGGTCWPCAPSHGNLRAWCSQAAPSRFIGCALPALLRIAIDVDGAVQPECAAPSTLSGGKVCLWLPRIVTRAQKKPDSRRLTGREAAHWHHPHASRDTPLISATSPRREVDDCKISAGAGAQHPRHSRILPVGKTSQPSQRRQRPSSLC
jgi:hypothetical protein